MWLSVDDNTFTGYLQSREQDVDELLSAVTTEETSCVRGHAAVERNPVMHALAFELIETAELERADILPPRVRKEAQHVESGGDATPNGCPLHRVRSPNGTRGKMSCHLGRRPQQ
ncbi:hypothetical protein MTO96_013178 [Rhipicephalus appendiculatus]